MRVEILRGLSGSGKSTYVAKMKDDEVIKVVSADTFFTHEDGYHFDPCLLPAAHGECIRKFIYLMQWTGHKTKWGGDEKDPTVVIVDNTNTTAAEIAPYYAIAEAYRVPVEIVEFDIDVEVAVARNLHNVPRRGIERQAANMMQPLPPWWKVRKAI
jgi:hypothetical protein